MDSLGLGENDALIIIAVVFLGALVVIGAIVAVLSTVGDPKQARLNRIVSGAAPRAADAAGPVSLRRDTAASSIGFVDDFIKKNLPRPAVLQERLVRTGKSFRIGPYLFTNMLVGMLIVVGMRLSGLPVALCVLSGLVGGVGLPYMWVGRLIGKRKAKFVDQLPDAVDLIVRGLKTGLPVPETIKQVGLEMADPIAGEFRQITEGVRIGQSLDTAMWDVDRRIDVQEYKFFCISCGVQRETGGNLAETLENLSDIIRRRRQMRLKIKAMSSEAKASAYIVGALPFLMFVLLYVLNPAYAGLLISDPRGVMMAFGAMGSIGMGAFIMSRMVSFEI